MFVIFFFGGAKMKAISLSVVLSSLFVVPAGAATILVDNFDEADTLSISNSLDGTIPTNGTLGQYEALSAVLGGFREGQVRNYDNPLTASTLSTSGSQLNAVRGNGNGDFVLRYFGQNETSIIDGNWNYTGLSDAISLQLTFSANTTTDLRVNVLARKWDGGYNNFVSTASAEAFVPVGASMLDLSLSALNLALFGGIDQFEIVFTTPRNQSFSVDSIVAVVPEPTSFALVGVVAMTLLTRRERRQ